MPHNSEGVFMQVAQRKGNLSHEKRGERGGDLALNKKSPGMLAYNYSQSQQYLKYFIRHSIPPEIAHAVASIKGIF